MTTIPDENFVTIPFLYTIFGFPEQQAMTTSTDSQNLCCVFFFFSKSFEDFRHVKVFLFSVLALMAMITHDELEGACIPAQDMVDGC
jgi:hypothetical protein